MKKFIEELLNLIANKMPDNTKFSVDISMDRNEKEECQSLDTVNRWLTLPDNRRIIINTKDKYDS